MSKSRMADTVLDHVAALLSRNGTSKK